MTAKDFREDLLISLGTLTNWAPLEPARFKDVVEAICSAKGIHPDDFGVRDYDGKRWVEAWIRSAFRWAKRSGYGEQIKRGWWTLTAAGVEKARKLGGVVVPVAAIDDDSQPTEPESGLCVLVGPGNKDDGYHSDPHIRALAANKTECYGHYSPKAPTCAECGLSGGCQNLVAAVYSVLAAELAEKDAEEAERAQLIAEAAASPTSPPDLDPEEKEVTPARPTPPPGGWDNSGSQEIRSFVKSTCYRCGQEIPKDITCYWIKDGDQRGGMYHTHCQ